MKHNNRRAIQPNRTLADASDHAAKWKWTGRRSAARSIGQMRGAIDTLCEVIGRDVKGITLADVTFEHIQACVGLWRHRDKLANTTVNCRLSTLSALGVDCTGCWVSSDIGLKWWLRPEQADDLTAWLRTDPPPFQRAHLMADYVDWSAHVGMRVEETLRLTRADISLKLIRDVEADTLVNLSEVTVPGTKTGDAQATIAISLVPALLLERRLAAMPPDGSARVFDISYFGLKDAWQHCRKRLGVADNRLATLKALRRTAARHLTVNGMPLSILAGVLRHSNTRTTEGYLKLVGGYSPAEQRKWLK